MTVGVGGFDGEGIAGPVSTRVSLPVTNRPGEARITVELDRTYVGVLPMEENDTARCLEHLSQLVVDLGTMGTYGYIWVHNRAVRPVTQRW